MPLTAIQKRVAGVLKPFRTDSHYIAGGAALNRRWQRVSDDLDIWADAPGLPKIVEAEIEALRRAGFTVEIEIEDNYIVEVIVRDDSDETRIEWAHSPNTQTRFFPAQADDDLGFRMHDLDNAINKILAASRRRNAPRDIVDLASILDHIAPLGPLVWAATGLPGEDRSATEIIRDIRTNANAYTREQYRTIRMAGDAAIDRQDLIAKIERALDDAADYCEDMAPIGHPGCLFLNVDGKPEPATEDDLDELTIIGVRDYQATPILR